MKKISVLLSLIMLSSCAVTEGNIYSAQSCFEHKQGVVTFYRDPGFTGSGLAPLLKVNGKEVYPIFKGGYLTLYMNAGEYDLEVVDNKGDMAAWNEAENINAKLVVEGGKEQYYKFVVQSWSPALPIPIGYAVVPVGGSRKSAILEVESPVALVELARLKGETKNLNNLGETQGLAPCENSLGQSN